MRRFVCPSNEFHCPKLLSDNILFITSTTETYFKSHFWMEETIPLYDAHMWFCKFVVGIDPKIMPNNGEFDAPAYISLTLTLNGFSEDVALILQPKNQYIDHGENSDTSTTKVYQGKNSQKYYIPGTYDVLIHFAPVKSEDGSTVEGEGYFMIEA